MTTYNIGIEARGQDEDLDDNERSRLVGKLVEAFSRLPKAHAATVSWGGLFAGPGVQVTVEADSPGQAVARALELFERAVGRAGMSWAQPVRVDLMTDDYFLRWLEEPPPTLVGVTEIARALGVSKQRVSELRATHKDFPAPVADLAAGPVWTLPSLQRFVERWPRKSGRPPAAQVRGPAR